MGTDLSSRLAPSAQLGRAARLEDAGGRFIESVKSNFPRGMRLEGLRIVIDCANGAAYRVAPAVLWELGAEVIRIGVEPDGFNINRGCGSTAPAMMQEEVRRHGAHLGIALDGDADRVIIADETGAVVDGDQILALIARAWSDAGRLAGGGVVATVMSNLGLERFLGARGLKLHRTRVGDRYVMETMRGTGCNVGGEQSGHILLLDHGTTGCGLTAALQVLAVLVETGRPASEVLQVFRPLPQLLRSVRYEGVSPLETGAVRDAIAAAELALNGTGRLVIRPSGTEPVIRVMAEAEDERLVTSLVDSLCDEIARAAA
jgi:phosphoglucosamine mutase